MKHRYRFPIVVRFNDREVASGSYSFESEQEIPPEEIEECRAKTEASLNKPSEDKRLVTGTFILRPAIYKKVRK